MTAGTMTRILSMHCKHLLSPCHLVFFLTRIHSHTLLFCLRMPLYHFVTADLPSNTKAPELDDTNAAAALRSDAAWSGIDASAGAGVTEDLVGLYCSYLVKIGFLPGPTEGGHRPLPAVEVAEEQRTAIQSVGGRGGMA